MTFDNPNGTLFWITGLAGAGKSTIASALRKRLLDQSLKSIMIDGDCMREVLQMAGRHGIEDRRWLAWSYARMGRLFSMQGHIVVCATISPFPEIRTWLRENVPNYIEIFVRVCQETLAQRDQKSIYSLRASNQITEVVGIDIAFETPANPDLVIANEPDTDPNQHAISIVEYWLNRLQTSSLKDMETKND